MRRFGFPASLAAVLMLCGAWAAHETGPVSPEPAPVSIAATPVPLDKENPGRVRIGELTYMGGIQLNSASQGFGGYSGLRFLPDGRMLAISDRGHWLTFRPIERQGRLTGLAEAVQGVLRDEAGQPLRHPHYDSESLEVISTPTGELEILVGFELNHRVWRYTAPAAPLVRTGTAQKGAAQAMVESAFSQPPQTLPWLEGWPGKLPANAGLEALAVKPDGAALLVAEGTGEGRFRPHADAPWTSIRYSTEDGFRPTDAAFLPLEGRHVAVIINRYFTLLDGVAARLELVDLDAAQNGKLEGKLLARLKPPVAVDNMEAVAVRPNPKGGWNIYVMSDDNQNPLQRTLLLKFHLPASVLGS